MDMDSHIQNMDSHIHSVKGVLMELVKVAPPAFVAGFTFFGHPLSEWAQLLAIIYSALMIFFLLRDRAWPMIKEKAMCIWKRLW